MNRTKIEWADYTWNPVTGCRHGCPYCYAARQTERFSGDVRLHEQTAKHWKNTDLYVLDEPMGAPNGRHIAFPYGFKPTLHKYRMNLPTTLKEGANIFVCSMADLFGTWVPDEWISMVFEFCAKAPQHNYMFLTKDPGRYITLARKGLLPKAENMWYGSSTPTPLTPFFYGDGYNTFLSIEPLLASFESVATQKAIKGIEKQKWVIIGSETGRRTGKVIPQRSWIDNIIIPLKKWHIPIFMKDSLKNIMGDCMLREFPEQLQLHRHAKHPLRDGRCSFCKRELPKKDMVALLARRKRGESAQSAGFACPECYSKFMQVLSTDDPVKGYEKHEK